jgi:(R,R)-butanediol dehydrogenase / meso-butanediol dehydrogenase / diacetyl reductase
VKALRFYGPKDLRLDDIPEPSVKPGTVKIQVEWCGICGSDLHEYQAGPIFIPPAGKPHPLTGETLPVTMGHEFAGKVAAVGQGVTGFQTGEKVTVEPIIACGECRECRQGNYNLCRMMGFIGLSGMGGGFAEFAVVPEQWVHRLPDPLTTEDGALVEPLAVALHAVRKARFGPGKNALVFGAGPIGLAAVQCLRAAGSSLVAVAEVSSARKEMARRIGADVVIDPREEDVVATAFKLTRGVGFDTTFDAAGTPATFKTALEATARGGTMVNIAIWEKPVELNLNELVFSEVRLRAVLAYSLGDFPGTIALMRDGRVRAREFVTRKIKLENVVAEGFEELSRNKEQHVKILVQP